MAADRSQGRCATGGDHRPERHRRAADDPAHRDKPGGHRHRVRAVQHRDHPGGAVLSVAGPVGARTPAAADPGLSVGRLGGHHPVPGPRVVGRRRVHPDPGSAGRFRVDGIARTDHRGSSQRPVPADHDDRPSPPRAELADRLPGVRRPGRSGFRVVRGHPLHRQQRIAGRLAGDRCVATDHGAVRPFAVRLRAGCRGCTSRCIGAIRWPS